MATRKLTAKNDSGLPARAASTMVMTLDTGSAQVKVGRGRKRADPRRIHELLLHGAATGSVIEVTASGDDEELAIATLTCLVLQGFGDGARSRRN